MISIKELVPGIVINGLLFVLPPWMGIFEMGMVLVAVFYLMLWIAVELYWRGYRIASPLKVE